MSSKKSALMDPKERKKLKDALRGKGKETPNVLNIPAGPVEGRMAKKAGGMLKKKGYKMGGMMKKGYKAGGKMPDLTGDGKVTQADVLKGRGAFKTGGMAKKGYAKGGMMKKGYKKGGKVRGAGKATKGVRAAKMVTMKGS